MNADIFDADNEDAFSKYPDMCGRTRADFVIQ